MTTTPLIFAAALTVALLSAPSASTKPDICLLSSDEGSCEVGRFNRWYFDHSVGKCRRFLWNGCGGNENKFDTLFECEQTCQYTCQLPAETGLCQAFFSKWHYDSSTGECKTFTWGGCGGNDNKFNTKELCENACKPGVKRYNCPARDCPNTCQFGNEVDTVGCPLCLCRLNPNQEVCPRMECSSERGCYGSYRVDSSGCPSCECNDCGPVCMIGCGFYTDENGKFSHFPLDLKEDANGCPYCSCQSIEDLCGVMQCDLECQAGYVKDINGCSLCQCKPVHTLGPIQSKKRSRLFYPD